MKYPIPVLLTSITLATSSFGAVIFSDSFENPPDIVGENPVGWTVSSTGIVVRSTRASEGTQSLFIRDGVNRLVTQSPTVSIPGGGQDLVFSFDFALNSSTEGGEGLTGFFIDFGSGFETVLIDEGQANGYANVSNYTGTTIVLSNAAGGNTNFRSYEITVPASYYGNATDFAMRFRTNSSTTVESFYLDNISVSTVPEPSFYATMMSLGALLVVGLRRRRK